MVRDLIFEIGVEEIPAAYMPKALEDFKNNALESLNKARLHYEEVKSLGTPRRLTLYVKGLRERQEDAVIESRGPKKAAAFDQEGRPTRALEGFARSQNINVEDIEVREVNGVEYVFAVKTEKGRETSEVLPSLLYELVKAFSFPKSMRWGGYSFRFARPIRWLLALYGEEKIVFNLENITSSNYTYGHRFLSPGRLEVKNAGDYFKVLENNYVIIDQERRKELIWQQIEKVASELGGRPLKDEDLLDEINYLVEYPTAFAGSFSSSYLEVPKEVLTTTMIENQRYVPVFDREGRLMPVFIGVRNGTGEFIDIVRAGNERVLKARLEDALFFWKEDLKQPLDKMAEKLGHILFHERLGSVMDKVKRITNIALFIGEKYRLSHGEKIRRAAYLCKADLVSNMVYEFPELQGIMGRYYALNHGEDEEVSQAIFEHYLPRFAGDELPGTETGTVLSLAEKIDNLTGFFAMGIKPSGSQDPYALRRQAMGIVNIVLDKGIKMDLYAVLEKAYQEVLPFRPERGKEETREEVLEFILQRMRGIMLEEGISYDVVDAVLACPSGDLVDIMNRAQILKDFRGDALFTPLMTVFNRCYNLSKKWESPEVDTDVLQDETEKVLYLKYEEVKDEVERAIDKGDYRMALVRIAGLQSYVDDFFNAVMVMVEDEKLKAARLGILKSIVKLCNKIADFSKIVE
ncbi:glycyl-tRNA synthetase beta chain [Thermosyntropha lipolytica DSM 11003]|uniref:Glycine--tRNA ligase beta subunit n=1 Tax=Thermosyntropha lipolytica DSM 11003 TaxID=1123382 RepID=A0A1M5N9T3_9FIRM|nr:glycine--tRNA ligase subunit beta [Thermosyntropha lipolytica]SHG86261.1 glycyl-tRNA synthetase beta chain [Thermosyntropha lipolytica DSM 11003]